VQNCALNVIFLAYFQIDTVWKLTFWNLYWYITVLLIIVINTCIAYNTFPYNMFLEKFKWRFVLALDNCKLCSIHWDTEKIKGAGVSRFWINWAILLLHDNARPHTSNATNAILEQLNFEVIQHPPYSPYLAPCDFHFFPVLKRHLKGTHFNSKENVQGSSEFFNKRETYFIFQWQYEKLVVCWDKFISVNGDYFEKLRY
jgi:hypothetical protein